LDLLRAEILPALREIVPNEADFRKLWFQQDGCPAYNSARYGFSTSIFSSLGATLAAAFGSRNRI